MLMLERPSIPLLNFPFKIPGFNMIILVGIPIIII